MNLKAAFLSAALAAGSAPVHASAPTAYINDVNLDPITQSATITAITDLGFPTGERAVQTNIHCQPASASVTAYKPDNAGAYSDETDPDALPVIAASKLIQMDSAAVKVNSTGGTLRMFCKDQVLYTDFSGAFGPGSRPDQDNLGDGHVRLRRWPTSGTIDLTYPIFAQTTAGQTTSFDLYVSLNGDRLSTAGTIQNFVIDYTGTGNRVGVFLYDAQHKVLHPLRYGGNDSGIPAVRGTRTGERLEVYFAVDYTVKSDWRKLTIDLKNGQLWNVPATPPAGATFGR